MTNCTSLRHLILQPQNRQCRNYVKLGLYFIYIRHYCFSNKEGNWYVAMALLQPCTEVKVTVNACLLAHPLMYVYGRMNTEVEEM